MTQLEQCQIKMQCLVLAEKVGGYYNNPKTVLNNAKAFYAFATSIDSLESATLRVGGEGLEVSYP